MERCFSIRRANCSSSRAFLSAACLFLFSFLLSSQIARTANTSRRKVHFSVQPSKKSSLFGAKYPQKFTFQCKRKKSSLFGAASSKKVHFLVQESSLFSAKYPKKFTFQCKRKKSSLFGAIGPKKVHFSVQPSKKSSLFGARKFTFRCNQFVKKFTFRCKKVHFSVQHFSVIDYDSSIWCVL